MGYPAMYSVKFLARFGIAYQEEMLSLWHTLSLLFFSFTLLKPDQNVGLLSLDVEAFGKSGSTRLLSV